MSVTVRATITVAAVLTLVATSACSSASVSATAPRTSGSGSTGPAPGGPGPASPSTPVDRYTTVPACDALNAGKTMDGLLDPGAPGFKPVPLAKKPQDTWTSARACSGELLDPRGSVQVRVYLFASTAAAQGSALAASYAHAQAAGGTADPTWGHASPTWGAFPVDGWLWRPGTCQLLTWRANLVVAFSQIPVRATCKPVIEHVSRAFVPLLP